MMRLILVGAVIPLAVLPASSAAANPTVEQLTAQCRPQLQTMIDEFLNESPPEDDPAAAAELVREKAALRANGINDPILRKTVDEIQKSVASRDQNKVRRELAELKKQMAANGITDGRGQGYDAAGLVLAKCVTEAILAKNEKGP